MKNTKNKTEKGFWHSVKTVGHFLLLLTIKGFSKPTKPVVAPNEGQAGKQRGGALIQLMKFLSGKAKGSLNKEVKETKELLRQTNNPKRQRKTWARVKQDFRDYYQDMIEEFTDTETPSLPKETVGNETGQ